MANHIHSQDQGWQLVSVVYLFKAKFGIILGQTGIIGPNF